jgi:hypothetical protein
MLDEVQHYIILGWCISEIEDRMVRIDVGAAVEVVARK